MPARRRHDVPGTFRAKHRLAIVAPPEDARAEVKSTPAVLPAERKLPLMLPRDASRCARGTEYVAPTPGARFQCGCVACAPFAWCVPCRIAGRFNPALSPAERAAGSEPICARCAHNAKPQVVTVPFAQFVRDECPELANGPLKRSLTLYRASQDAPGESDLDQRIARQQELFNQIYGKIARDLKYLIKPLNSPESQLDKVRPKPDNKGLAAISRDTKSIEPKGARKG